MIRLTLFFIILYSGSSFAQEPTNCTPIRFERGQSSATVTGSVGSEDPLPCYTLAAGSGQTASLKFVRTNGNMAFSIYDLIDNRDSYSFRHL